MQVDCVLKPQCIKCMRKESRSEVKGLKKCAKVKSRIKTDFVQLGLSIGQPVYCPGWTDLWTDTVSCPSVTRGFQYKHHNKKGKTPDFYGWN